MVSSILDCRWNDWKYSARHEFSKESLDYRTQGLRSLTFHLGCFASAEKIFGIAQHPVVRGKTGREAIDRASGAR